MRTQLSWKKCLLVICKILGVFVNTLTADGMYSLLNSHNLLQHLQMILSQKQKNFSWYSFAIWKCRFNFENFQKKDDRHRWCIVELTDSETHGQINVSKVPLQKALQQVTWLPGWKTVEILTTAPLPYLLITVKAIQFLKVSPRDMQNLRTFC